MKARLLGGIAALVVAIIGTVLLFNYVQGADRRALANTETEDVLVVKQEVPAGTPASQLGQFVVTKSVPRTALAPTGLMTSAPWVRKSPPSRLCRASSC